MRISDWSSDVCLPICAQPTRGAAAPKRVSPKPFSDRAPGDDAPHGPVFDFVEHGHKSKGVTWARKSCRVIVSEPHAGEVRSEERRGGKGGARTGSTRGAPYN